MKSFIKNEKDLVALILRVGFGIFIVFGHGFGKLQMLLSGDIQFPPLFGLDPKINLIMAVIFEFVAGLALIFGLLTRLASLGLMGIMFVAAFIVHLSDPWFAMNAAGGGSKEMAVLYFLAFLVTFILGGGKYSLDALIFKKK
jgi:putative oxidoreductase